MPAGLVEYSPELKALTEHVLAKFQSAEQRHRSYRDQWSHYYSLYRSYSGLRDAHRSGSPRDRDEILHDGKREWGAELFIPYTFATVETILPRALSNRPRMLVLPRNRASERNVENMKGLIDSQQEQIRYELKLQDTAKSGFIYGLGVQKTLWRTEKRKIRVNVEGTAPGAELGNGARAPEWTTEEQERVLFDDPDVEDVDIFDFFWDPFGHSMDTCRWAIHRTWRPTEYVRDRLESGVWNNPAMLDPARVEDMGSAAKHGEVIHDRMQAAGHSDFQSRDGQLHEVWEFHDREQVVTLLDRECPVSVMENPAWHGELPFHAYRPQTSGIKELLGIGEVEPIEHLQLEMNTLRSQRRDNATLKLQQVFAYADGLVPPEDLQFFPGAAIPVVGDPRDLLFPINVGDIPNSGYQEEANLQADIERTTGISDAQTGTGDAGQTATGVQLVQAAANVRIQMKTRRIEVELVQPEAHQFVLLNQQQIIDREQRVPAPPTPQDPGRRWAWVTLTPGELAGEFDIVPEGGSTAPENIPQMRADGQALMNNLRDNPLIDQRRLFEEFLRMHGVKAPEGWLQPDQRVPPVLLDILVQRGLIQKDALVQAYDEAVATEEQQRTASPNRAPNVQGPPGQQEPEAATSDRPTRSES